MTRMTAEELGITPIEYEALLWVRDCLDPDIPDKQFPAWHSFDMETWAAPNDDTRDSRKVTCENLAGTPCGTAACIGGSMDFYILGLQDLDLGGKAPEDAVEIIRCSEGADTYLGNPVSVHRDLGSLTSLFLRFDRTATRDPGTATDAIDRYLSGNIGDPWQVQGTTREWMRTDYSEDILSQMGE